VSNFRAFPGKYVRAVKSECGLVENQIYQVLNIRYNITLLGVNGTFTHTKFAQLVEPIDTPSYRETLPMPKPYEKTLWKRIFNG
jgi:hypothetical protein